MEQTSTTAQVSNNNPIIQSDCDKLKDQLERTKQKRDKLEKKLDKEFDLLDLKTINDTNNMVKDCSDQILELEMMIQKTCGDNANVKPGDDSQSVISTGSVNRKTPAEISFDKL